MKRKKPQKPKEGEKPPNGEKGELADFYPLLDTLLPQGEELLLKVLKTKEEDLIDIRDREKDKLKFALELEKQKNSCWKEYANILFAQYQRRTADYENFQKRVPKQISDTISYEKERIIKTLLPTLDNFEHTLQNAHSAENIDVLVKGIQIIYDQMLDILKSHGVEQIKAMGEAFDPALHEAMMQRAEPEREENIVLEEFQTGYKLNGRVIRPSKVVVNKPSSEQETAQQKQATDEDGKQ